MSTQFTFLCVHTYFRSTSGDTKICIAWKWLFFLSSTYLGVLQMGISHPGANYLSDCFFFFKTLLALGLSHSLDNFSVPMLSKAIMYYCSNHHSIRTHTQCLSRMIDKYTINQVLTKVSRFQQIYSRASWNNIIKLCNYIGRL